MSNPSIQFVAYEWAKKIVSHRSPALLWQRCGRAAQMVARAQARGAPVTSVEFFLLGAFAKVRAASFAWSTTSA